MAPNKLIRAICMACMVFCFSRAIASVECTLTMSNRSYEKSIACSGPKMLSYTLQASAGGTGYGYVRLNCDIYIDGQKLNKTHCCFTYFTYSGYYSQAWQYQDAKSQRIYLSPGNHTVKWSISGPNWMDTYNPQVSVINCTLSAMPSYDSLYDWAKAAYEDETWIANSLGGVIEKCDATISTNPADYEARISRALAKVAQLGDNTTLRFLIEQFGFIPDDFMQYVAGEFAGFDNIPQPNAVVDTVSTETLSAIDSALSDLSEIPEDWSGVIALTSEKYSMLPDTTYIDNAELMMLRAVLNAVRGTVQLVDGYDFTADYVAVSNAYARSSQHEGARLFFDIFDSMPDVGNVRDVQKMSCAKEDFRSALLYLQKSDAAIVARKHAYSCFLEYDSADADDIAEARKVLDKVIASLDEVSTVDGRYFVGKYGSTIDLPNGFVRQLYLGALFAGRVTRDCVGRIIDESEIEKYEYLEEPTDVLRLIPDPTFGGVAPDVTISEVVSVYSDSQYFNMSDYMALSPELQLALGNRLVVEGVASKNGNVEFDTATTGLVTCYVEGNRVLGFNPWMDEATSRFSFPVTAGDRYAVDFMPVAINWPVLEITEPTKLIDFTSVPSPLQDGGPYTETVDGVDWTFSVKNEASTIVSIPNSTAGAITVPSELGGRSVVAIGEDAFAACKSITSVTVASTVESIASGAFYKCTALASVVFLGDKPSNVTDDAFSSIPATCEFFATRAADWTGVDIPGTWQNHSISYVAGYDASIVVAPSTEGGDFGVSTSIELEAAEGHTIRYTLDGTEPTKISPSYTGPIAINSTCTVKFFAVNDETGDWGPVGTVSFERIPAENPEVVVTPSVPDGTRFVGSQNVTLNAGSGKTIYYTTDGSDPITSPTRIQYTGSVYMSGTTTLKYYAVDNAYGDWSAVQTAKYTVRKVDGGYYSETVNGITWYYYIYNGEAYLGKNSPTATSPSTQNLAVSSSSALTGSVALPEELGGCQVVGISACAFYYCSGLTSVTIPNSVTSIGDHAFFYCWNLTSVTIPDSVTSIGAYAFYYCPRLMNVMISDSVTSIGDCTFAACTALTSVRIPDSVTSIGDGAFNMGGYGPSNLSSIIMEGDAPTLGSDVFYQVPSACVVYVHKGSTGWDVPIPGTWQGMQIRYIEDAVYPEIVGNVIWSYQSVNGGVRLLPAGDLGVAELAEGHVDIPATLNGSPVTKIGKGVFQGASKVTSVTIPESVDAIEASAFRECTRLESVELPEGLTEIGDSAFRECVSLRSITIPASVTNIGYFAFRDCLRLETVNLLGHPPRRDLGVYMGVPAFTTISGRLGAATAIIYAAITNSTEDITVPEEWLDEIANEFATPAGSDAYKDAFEERFGSDFQAALTKPTGKTDLHGNPLYVWQDYVAGTDPLDEEDKFTATIKIENGLPVVEWKPELPPSKAVLRKYTTLGATALGGEWVDVSSLSDVERQAAGYQFFQVTVEMK